MEGDFRDPQRANRPLADLYERVRLGFASQPIDRQGLIQEILGHPASASKLFYAANAVLKSFVMRRDLQGDLMQEAALIVAERLAQGRLSFESQGYDDFCGWLWTLWFDACRTALKRQQRDWKRAPTPVGKLDDLPDGQWAGTLPPHAWNDMLALIRHIHDPDVNAVLTDWAEGLSGLESARYRQLSTATISRLRNRGFAHIRSELGSQWFVD